jgi:hypothetical protein
MTTAAGPRGSVLMQDDQPLEKMAKSVTLAKKQRAERPFNGCEQLILVALLLLAGASACLLWAGRLSL